MEFPKLLKAARIRAGLSASESAALAGTSTSYWYEVERGVKQPTISKLVDMASALNCDPAELLPTKNKSAENC